MLAYYARIVLKELISLFENQDILEFLEVDDDVESEMLGHHVGKVHQHVFGDVGSVYIQRQRRKDVVTVEHGKELAGEYLQELRFRTDVEQVEINDKIPVSAPLQGLQDISHKGCLPCLGRTVYDSLFFIFDAFEQPGCFIVAGYELGALRRLFVCEKNFHLGFR